MAFVISAYAPPTFLKPCLVWMTCQCNDTGEGAHMLGCFVGALNSDYALEMVGHALSESHKGGAHWFLMEEFSSFTKATRAHLQMAKAMQNGRSTEMWEAGWEPYLQIWEKYATALQYESPGAN